MDRNLTPTRWLGRVPIRIGLLYGVAAVVCALIATMLAVTPSAEAAPARTAVWIGSPLSSSTWPNASGCSGSRYPSAACSLPTTHHTYNYGDPYAGDVGWDLQSVAANAPVTLYAAPQNTAYNNQITAHVLRVVPACGKLTSSESDAARIKRGGQAVVIELRHRSTPIGTVRFVHVNATVRAGQTLNRWGARIGTVGTYANNKCWKGRHLHMELMNHANYACFNKDWKAGQAVKAHEFVGYLGGTFARARSRACP